ncbi:hypothetical protein FACS189474_2190 [Bacteroidia bacterium]|nr:hypothetical protein FACS189474_2190 [Bacteroidia bacterium]
MLLSFLGVTTSMNEQVTIGSENPPHSGAVLDLQSTSQGLKLPTVSITNWSVFGLPVTAASTAANAKGMIAYNTNTTTGEGLYFWDGSQWIPVKESIGTNPVTGITITSAGDATSLLYNGTLQLTATIAPSDASNKEVTWGVVQGVQFASVSPSGLVSGIKNGNAVIVASAGGKNAYYEIRVKNPNSPATMHIGNNDYLTYDYSGSIWMVQNLKEGSSGTNIKTQYNVGGTPDPDVQTNPTVGQLGYYYNAASAQSACPTGWHLPTLSEATELCEYLNSTPNKGEMGSYPYWIRQHGGGAGYNTGPTNKWMDWGISGRYIIQNGRIICSELGASILSPTDEFQSVRCVKN